MRDDSERYFTYLKSDVAYFQRKEDNRNFLRPEYYRLRSTASETKLASELPKQDSYNPLQVEACISLREVAEVWVLRIKGARILDSYVRACEWDEANETWAFAAIVEYQRPRTRWSKFKVRWNEFLEGRKAHV